MECGCAADGSESNLRWMSNTYGFSSVSRLRSAPNFINLLASDDYREFTDILILKHLADRGIEGGVTRDNAEKRLILADILQAYGMLLPLQ